MDSQPQPVEQAYNQYEREVAIANIKIGCILGMVLVPSFAIIDYTVYPNLAGEFLLLRLACSALIGAFFTILLTSFGTRNYRVFGVVLVLLPGSCISYMIYRTQGADSPYYAGLNLVLLVVGFVLRWTFRESLIAVSLVVAEYLAACRLHAPFTFHGIVVNNLYFLFSTGVIVATGNHYFSLSRYREFVSRFELDKSRKALEASLHQLKENEMQLVQSEKLASLGRMSAGIIHEINNPLNFATTGIFTLRKKGKLLAPEQQADYAEVLTDVEDGLKRVQNIVSDLRQFTHPNTEQIDPVPVAEIVTPALRFLSNESRDTVQIEQKLEAKQMIWANKNKLIQVLLNLLQNSIDALKEKKFPDGEKPTIWIEGRVENGQSILSVRDNGSGIDAKHLGKIFDPFFTTKDVGSGMGLGLSICYSIVQECGGKISVKTETGKFCEFTLEFPLKNKQSVN